MQKIKAIIYICLLSIVGNKAIAQEWTNPVIKNYGKIKYYKDVAMQPDRHMDYKIVFNITTDKEIDGVNAGLWKMARTINLLRAGGVKERNIHLVGVIHGGATPTVLTDEAYQKTKGRPNPNLDILKVLKEHGVQLHVCGQAVAKANIDPDTEINKYITFSLSALIDIPTFQLKGYALMP